MSHKYVDDDKYKFIIITNVAVQTKCKLCLFFPNVMLDDWAEDVIFAVFFRNSSHFPYLELKFATDSF